MQAPLFVVTAGDLFSLIIFGCAVLLIGIAGAHQWLQQSRCKHKGRIMESQACDAICQQCGKNLGFIGTWRATNHD